MMATSLCPFNLPSFFSTVTPGQLPTYWFAPVRALNNVVLPQFGLPASAIVIAMISLLIFLTFHIIVKVIIYFHIDYSIYNVLMLRSSKPQTYRISSLINMEIYDSTYSLRLCENYSTSIIAASALRTDSS